MKKHLRVEMPDGSKWVVPVEVIARDRATQYADEFNGDIELSLKKDTLPLFESDEYEIEDWATNNMNWSDVVDEATELKRSPEDEVDYQEGWVDGDKDFVEI